MLAKARYATATTWPSRQLGLHTTFADTADLRDSLQSSGVVFLLSSLRMADGKFHAEHPHEEGERDRDGKFHAEHPHD